MYNDYEDDETCIIITKRDLALFPPETKVIEFRNGAIIYNSSHHKRIAIPTTAGALLKKKCDALRTYRLNYKKSHK